MVPRKPRSSRPTRTSHPESQSRSAALSPATASTCLTTHCGPSRAARLERSRSVAPAGDGILATACTVREDVPGVQQLVGYVVPRDGAEIDEAGVLSRLRSRLPAYMAPALIETVKKLPRLPSGKLDRASLPPPRPRKAASEARAGQPRTDTECRIAEVWAALFRPQP